MVYYQDSQQPPPPPHSPEVHRDLGKHDAQIEALQKQVEQLHTDLGAMLTQLQDIHSTLAEARGGWKTLMATAGLASAVTAVVLKGLGWLLFAPTPK